MFERERGGARKREVGEGSSWLDQEDNILMSPSTIWISLFRGGTEKFSVQLRAMNLSI